MDPLAAFIVTAASFLAIFGLSRVKKKAKVKHVDDSLFPPLGAYGQPRSVTDALNYVAKETGMSARHLAAVINWETGGKWRADTLGKGEPGKEALGAIGFVGSTIRKLGTTRAKLKAMTMAAQIRGPVLEYFRRVIAGIWDDKNPGALNTFQSVAMAVYFPWARYTDPHTPYGDIPGLSKRMRDNVERWGIADHTPYDYMSGAAQFAN